MSQKNASSRKPKHGVVLIATLVSLVLVIGLALSLQATALSGTRTTKELSKLHVAELHKDSIYEFSRPIVGIVVTDARLNRDATVWNVDAFGRSYRIQIFRSQRTVSVRIDAMSLGLL